MAFQFNLMGKWAYAPIYIAAFAVLHAHAANRSEFDQSQTTRLKAVRAAAEQSDKDSLRSLAKDNSATVASSLEDYKNFGPNQREVEGDLATAQTAKELIAKVLDTYSSAEGSAFSVVAAPLLEKEYGFSLQYNSTNSAWEVALAGTTQAEKDASFEKAKKAVGAHMKDAIWNSMDDEDKTRATNLALANLGKEIGGVLNKDANLDSDLKKSLEAKSTELGDASAGRIKALNKKMSVAKQDDATERRMLLAEKKTYDAAADSAASKSGDDVCKDFATNLAAPKRAADVQRRLRALTNVADDDVCKSAISKAAKTAGLSTSSGDRDTASQDDTSRLRRLADTSDEREHDRSGNSDSIATDRNGDRTGEESEDSDKVAALNARLKNAESYIQQMQGALGQERREKTLLACDRAAKNPFSLNSGNEKNLKVIQELSSKLEKTIDDNMVNLVCQQSAKVGDRSSFAMGEAARAVLTGMGISESGALTEAKVKTLEGISKQATQKAGQLAGGLRIRTQLARQIDEAAAQRALTRLVTEHSEVLDPAQYAASVNYLKNMSYAELIGQEDSQGNLQGGALALFLLPQYRNEAMSTFNDFYTIEQADLKEKNGVNADYADQVDCALALASEASQRYAIEANREGALGLNRSGLRGLAVSNPARATNVKSTRDRPI